MPSWALRLTIRVPRSPPQPTHDASIAGKQCILALIETREQSTNRARPQRLKIMLLLGDTSARRLHTLTVHLLQMCGWLKTDSEAFLPRNGQSSGLRYAHASLS